MAEPGSALHHIRMAISDLKRCREVDGSVYGSVDDASALAEAFGQLMELMVLMPRSCLVRTCEQHGLESVRCSHATRCALAWKLAEPTCCICAEAPVWCGACCRDPRYVAVRQHSQLVL